MLYRYARVTWACDASITSIPSIVLPGGKCIPLRIYQAVTENCDDEEYKTAAE